MGILVKPRFDECEKRATALLLSQRIRGLEINVFCLKHTKRIYCDRFGQYCKKTGISRELFNNKESYMIAHREWTLILFNELCHNTKRINWSVAHEIGHIYMEHTDDSELSEIEAHYFAACLLMPECVLRTIHRLAGELTSQQVASLFHVSIEAAQRRINAIQHKITWLNREEESILLYRYEPYILNYCNQFINSDMEYESVFL